MALIAKIAIGIVLGVFLLSYLFEARVTVGSGNGGQTTTLSTDEQLCNEGYQPSCKVIGR